MSVEYVKTNWQDGDIITADKMNNIENGINEIVGESSSLKDEDMLLRNEIPGTTQVVTFDTNKNPLTITHSISGTTVRTDVFTWGTNSVTEVRTLSTGKYITITTNLTTLEQTISAITEEV